jgi:hypothetical protein
MPEGGDEMRYAVDEGVRGEEEDQHRQGQSWQQEREDSEDDRDDAPQGKRRPVEGETTLHRECLLVADSRRETGEAQGVDQGASTCSFWVRNGRRGQNAPIGREWEGSE